MKAMKRYLAIFLAAVLVMGMVVGCTSKDLDSNTGSGEKSEKQQQEKDDQSLKQSEKVDKADFKGELKLAVPPGDYIDFMEKNIIPYFVQEYPNVKVTVMDDKEIDTKIAAGDIPDVYAGTFGFMPAKYAKMGKLVNYEQFEDYKQLFERINESYVIKNFGKIYYVPYNAVTQLMIYNKELFREAGLDPENPPETFDEFLEAAKKIDALPNREDGTDVKGTVFWNEALNWGGWYWTMLTQIYYNMNDGQYQLFNEYGTDVVFDKPEAKMAEFFDFMRKAQEYAPADMSKNFFSRSIGMWLQFGYGWKANLKEAADHPMEIGKDVGVAPIPVPNKGDVHWSTLDGRSLMIFKSNPEQEKLAWELVKFLMRDDKNLEACKVLGQLPTLKSLENDPYFQREEVKPFVQQLKHALPNEPLAEVDQVANILQQVYVEVVIEKKISPQEAVEKAAKLAREKLQVQ